MAFVCIFLVGALVRVIGVWRPVDQASWRESDMAAVARNYYREGMNILYPRIDWRGEGPGYAEMEFPIYPWLIAVLYEVFGIHDFFGRILSFIFSLFTLMVFFQLARYLMPEVAAVAASAFFALSPLVIRLSKSLQPDGLMLLFYILAVYAFIRWLDSDSRRYYVIALASTAMAILVKEPAAHIGLFFAALVLYRKGIAVLRQPRIWLFAVSSLLPALLWYAHARGFWLTYGNSLGLSNEYHWAGWDLFTNPAFILGIGRSELNYVWTPVGVLIVLLGVLYGWSEKVVKYGSFWLCVIAVYYLVAMRTTSDGWAVYYHVVSVPAVALLFGSGLNAIGGLLFRSRVSALFTLASATIAVGFAIGLAFSHLTLAGTLGVSSRSILALGLAIAAAVVAFLAVRRVTIGGRIPSIRLLGGYVAVAALPVTFLIQARVISYDIRTELAVDGAYACAKELPSSIPEGALILASGGRCKDAAGHPVAYNSSYLFYWMDRKGFNTCTEQQSVAEVNSFAGRGAQYFVAEKHRLNEKPAFEAELRSAFPLVKECNEILLFKLGSRSFESSPNADINSSVR